MSSTDPLDLPKHYQPAEAEARWDAYWEEHGYFHSQPDEREPYTVVIPPPNVTGVLHMGHMLNNTIQDVLVRHARMKGYNACWVPGTDHASIATEAKVVQRLRAKGIRKSDLSREDFLKHAWEWTHEHGGIILQQLRTLGASCDWKRTRFTLEPSLSEAVIDCFIDLHRKGHIYRGLRMIHWDPAAKTALSDEEVIYKETRSQLYHVRYPVEGHPDGIVIATTRPETILADTAIAVHPDDPRYRDLVGRHATVPVVDRRIPIIADEYVDREFGTGCLKITPAHDPNDYEIGLRHGLPVIGMLHADGTVDSPIDGLGGLDRFDARKEMVRRLEDLGQLVRTEEIENAVGFSERTDVPIEPRLSLQWFCRMDELAAPALKSVQDGDIRFHPAKFTGTYVHWMENIRDWCISRQLWWGHRIPAWYYGDGDEDYVIARDAQEAARMAAERLGRPVDEDELRQDEDVLDTWFSSWLWPISVFDGFKDPSGKEISYYYPTHTLVTAPEILFFWVARMIMAGHAFRGEIPFRDVYYHGIVRDSKRRKMSKSLGNSPDPLDLIRTYGADGTRVGMLFSSPAGNDLLFDEALCEQGRNFANKIWNAFRFLVLNREMAAEQGEEEAAEESVSGPSTASNLADDWFATRLSRATAEMDRQLAEFRLNDALKTLYSLIWDDFCDWYIELIKPGVPGQPIPAERLDRAFGLFGELMKLAHPFMPFLSEEIWHRIAPRTPAQALTVSPWPAPGPEPLSPAEEELFAHLQGMITAVRNLRAELNLPPKTPIPVRVRTQDQAQAHRLRQESWVLRRMLPSLQPEFGPDLDQTGAGRRELVGPYELFIPLQGLVDVDAERSRLAKEMKRLSGFAKGIEGKLANAGFTDRAPADVVDKERRKLADAKASIERLERMLQELG